jgi:hypothetical protein
MNFEQMANRVTENVDGGPPQFDVAILFMIIEVLQNIAPILQDFCNKKPEDVVKAARSLKPFVLWDVEDSVKTAVKKLLMVYLQQLLNLHQGKLLNCIHKHRFQLKENND